MVSTFECCSGAKFYVMRTRSETGSAVHGPEVVGPNAGMRTLAVCRIGEGAQVRCTGSVYGSQRVGVAYPVELQRVLPVVILRFTRLPG